ncbi:hypothetical protein [Paenibacillus sp. MSJ-34]|uniref:hypothetical protein n=1 Tax=Paenibacillus sp. MSJ-34 TaxID=2841529 RepID=UPI001C10B4DB|nr:hypothetical protein [Paenibacillus sp. MSJ-34]MBU5444050.1 hypothetical protein [Paenibacillus sp. MSJ-34]
MQSPTNNSHKFANERKEMIIAAGLKVFARKGIEGTKIINDRCGSRNQPLALMEGNGDIFMVMKQALRSEDVPERTMNLIEDISTRYSAHFLPLFIEGQKAGELIQGAPEELLEVYLAVISGFMTEEVRWWKDNLDTKVDLLVRIIS